MPNIKIYGIIHVGSIPSEEWDNAHILYEKIFKLFNKKSYAKDIVITMIPSNVINLKEEFKPYIQLELDSMKNYEEQIKLLKTLGYDIQVVKLHDFIPKE